MDKNEIKSRVYVRTDDWGRIVQIEGEYSLPNLGDLTAPDVHLIEEGPSCDRLNHAQNMYLGGPTWTEDGIPRYKLADGKAVPRTETEISADRIPPLDVAQAAKLAELSAACNAAIVDGCDVSLSDGYTGHIALTNEDQINLTNAVTTVSAGAERYPYHLDGALCAMYPAADILAMGQAATAHKLYHTTYYNHLAAWVRRCETAEELEAITYGAVLPEDMAASMADILAEAGADV